MLLRLISRIVILYLCWLGMLAVHECGHAINAVASGGRVLKVSFPLVGFSQTFVDPNPHPMAVAWGGPVWGVVLPVVMLIGWRAIFRHAPAIVWFFVGFCLISNGAYIGLGWMKRSGDAHDLVRDGAPRIELILFGMICFVTGLICWHQIPSRRWRLVRIGNCD